MQADRGGVLSGITRQMRRYFFIVVLTTAAAAAAAAVHEHDFGNWEDHGDSYIRCPSSLPTGCMRCQDERRKCDCGAVETRSRCQKV